jgi:hypothetical protein
VVGRPSLLFAAVGTNSLVTGGIGAATAFSQIAAYWSAAKTDGFTVVAFTVPARKNGGPEGYIKTYNDLVRASTGWDYLVEQAIALPDAFNLNYYNTDGIHPVAAGHVLIADSVNAAFGGAAITRSTFDGRRGSNEFSSDADGLGVSTGRDNTATGRGALERNVGGNYNTAVGSIALLANTSGINNTAEGYGALQSNVSGGGNTAVGSNSLGFNTASDNTGVGYLALFGNVSGTGNTAVGRSALQGNHASSNTAVGGNALTANDGGGNNCAVGYGALQSNTSGSNNVADGTNGLAFNSSGAGNTSVGAQALYSTTTTDNNVGIGLNAGRFLADGATANSTPVSSVMIGSGTRASAAGQSNEIAIGMGAIGDGSNTAVVGNTFTVRTRVAGILAIGATGAPTISFAAAAPAAGTWIAGSIVWNSAVAVGQPNGWRCTVAGTPGTWVAMANL